MHHFHKSVVEMKSAVWLFLSALILFQTVVILVLLDMQGSIKNVSKLFLLSSRDSDNFNLKDWDMTHWISGDIIEKPALPAHPFYLHYVRFKAEDESNITITFLDYLSILSGVRKLKPDGIFLHGDLEPTGKYWEELTRNGWIKYMARNTTKQLPGRTQIFDNVFHMADMAKLDVLIEYGGIAADFDVYFVRGDRIHEILGQHLALTCYGDHNGYNMGLIGFSKNSRLLHAWRRSYDVIYVKDWNFNSADVLKYLSEVFAEEVYVVNNVCNNPHPFHLGRFFNASAERMVSDWRNSIAIHTYHHWSTLSKVRTPEELKVNVSHFKELLSFIYEDKTLSPVDFWFDDRVDPLNDTALLLIDSLRS